MSIASISRAESPPSTAVRSSNRIPEIDGLRGIALTLVVFFHLFGEGRVSGGVDVFLFVSGVVLTMSLVSDVAKGKQRHILTRWTRTFGRLALPASLVLLAIILMAFTVLPPWQRSQTLTEVISAGLYFENWQLIFSQLTYEAAGPSTSPVQHFWSLSIQGQLFIVVPILVALVYSLRRFLRRPGVILYSTAAFATIASFLYAMHARAIDPDAAYFDSFARVWEFTLGILVAAAVNQKWRLPAASAIFLGWLGLFAILLSGFFIDGGAAYPGPAALVPVGGAALVVIAARSNTTNRSVSLLLRSAPLIGLNRYSYALYLWHWPLLIAFLALRGQLSGHVSWKGAIVVLAGSALLAVLTTTLLERPSRRWFLQGHSKKSVAIVLCAVLLVPAGATAYVVQDQLSRPSLAVGSCDGAAALDPQRTDCNNDYDPSEPLMPALADLSRDDDNRGECWASWDSDEVNICSLGPSGGYERHLLAVGDSHNNTLIGAYEKIAEQYNWRIDVAGRASCHWTTAYRFQRNDQATELCSSWNSSIDALVTGQDFDAIIVTNSSGAGYRAWGAKTEAEERRDGHVNAWANRADPTTPIIAIRDNPLFPSDEMACLEDPESIIAGECAFPRAEVLHEDGLDDAVERDPFAVHVDLTDYMCTSTVCPLVVGGVIVARNDGIHLSATFARTLAPYLGREIANVF